MTARWLFWMPALLRLALVWVAAGVAGIFLGIQIAFGLALLGMTGFIIVQLLSLEKLSRWVDQPDTERLTDGWGAWTHVFAKLYRLRRDDQANRKELVEWLARFRQAMHQLPDGVAIIDEMLVLEWCNPAAEQQLGLQLSQDQGRRVTNLIRHPNFIDYVILGRYEQPLTLHLDERKLIVRIIPFESRRQILVTHDATEAERIDQMRRDFIANASHELRTPLTVMNGFLEIAESQPDMDVATRLSHVRLMIEQGSRMQRLVEDMLILSRLESLDYPLRTEPISMASMLKQLMEEAQALSAGGHVIEVENHGPDMRGSYDELRSAFSNLISNAVRYTEPGGKVVISWKKTPNGAQFSVQDSGIGIAPEHISRLTERFYRVDKGRSRETKGTGLGLAIVKHVLLRHRAVLSIDSMIGKGSIFIVQFPFDQVIEFS